MAGIIKATPEQKRRHREIMPHGEPELYGYAIVSNQQCIVEYLGEGQGEPNYELIAPAGYCLGPQLHSELETTLAEMRDTIRHSTLEPCDPDCPCGKGGRG